MKSFIFLTVICITGSLTAQKHWNTTAKFDGNSYLAVAEPVLTETRPSLTIEFWIKPDKDSSSTTIMGNKQFWVLTEYGKIRLLGNGGTPLYSKSLLKSNKWTHVAAVYDGGGTNDSIKVYLNGVLDNSAKFTETLFGQPDSFLVGKKYFNTFSGEIDEIRIWRVARTADQIRNNFRTHIASYWLNDIFHYGELAYVQSYESDISDSLFYLPNGKVNGTVTPIASGMMSSPTVRHNNAVYFSGGTWSWLESVDANDTNVCFTGDLTVEAWINPSSFDTRMVIVDLNNGGGGFQLSTVADAKLNWYLPPQATTTAMALLPNTWYHVAVVVDSNSPGVQNARMYVNGKLINTSTHNAMTLNTGKLRIGASHSNTDYFKGYMDEVRISNFAKTEAEIKENMYNPIHYYNQPTPPRSTVAYGFDGGYYSSTRKGPRLEDMYSTCRFSYYNEPGAPLFSLGNNHKTIMSDFTTVQRAAFIPEFGSTSGTITDTLTMNKAVKIDPNKFKVFLALTHNNISDLKIELISPTGETIELINQISSIPGKQITLLIDTQQFYKISNTAFIDHGPSVGFNNSFSALNGKNSKGVWSLKVSDLKLANTGRLYSWGISVSGEPIAPNSTFSPDKASFVIYPNPSSGSNVFHIKTEAWLAEKSRITFSDLNGRIVFESDIEPQGDELKVALEEALSAGCYFVKIVSPGGSGTAKLQVY